MSFRHGGARGGGVGVALPLAAVALLVACSRPPERLVMARMAQPAGVLVYVGQDHGTFRAAGLDVVWRDYPAGRDALSALLAHEVDVAVAYTTPVVLQSFDHPELRVLTTLHTGRRNCAIVLRRDRGIVSAEGLRGRTIALTPGTSAEYFMGSLLAYSAIPASAVHVINREPNGLVEALRTGEVDGIVVWPPLLGRAERALGPNGAVVLHSDVYDEASLVVTRADVLATRRPALLALIRALARAEAIAADDPAAAPAALARALPGEDPVDLRSGLARVTPRLGLDNRTLTLLDTAAEWFGARQGRRGPPPRYVDMLAPSLLLEVEPEAVTVEGAR